MQFKERTQELKNPPMKTAVLNILAFTFLLIAAASCKKSDDNSTTPPKSKTILLTQASWKIQSVGIDADKNGTADSDVTSSVPACQVDNTFTFKTDGSGTMDEAALKCAPADPQTKPFTWTFKSTETILSGTFSFTSGDATIVSMNDTSMVVTYDDNLGTPITYHFIVTLKH